MATQGYKRAHGLTDQQRLAIEVLVCGGTHAEAADTARVNRVTVSRWHTCDAEFEAELNRRRAELYAQSGHRLRVLLGRAVEAVARKVEDGDADAALALLRLCGVDHLLGAAVVGRQSADAILDAEARATREDPVARLVEDLHGGGETMEDARARVQAARAVALLEVEV